MANLRERLVELINLASTEVDGTKKVEYLYQIKELSLNHGLLEDFFDEILAFQSDRAPSVKKFILAFIEAACKHDFKFCPRSIFSLNLLLNDTNNEVMKRSIQAATHFYKALAIWIVKTQQQQQQQQQPLPHHNNNNQQQQQHHNQQQHTINNSNTEIEQTWLLWLQIQSLICNLLESTNNDGVRTHCIKFIETIILMQTPADGRTDASFQLNLIDPAITPVRLNDEATMCGVEGLPKSGTLFNDEHKLDLVEAAKRRFDQLVVFHGTSHISSVNLMATMQSLVVLAKQRSRLFMKQTSQAMEAINARLPPTLTESQVQSVKKFLKLQYTVLMKHNGKDLQKRIKLEPGIQVEQKPQPSSLPPSKAKHLDLNKLTQELDEKEKRQIVVDSVKRILNDEKCIYISPAQMEIKKKVLSTLANEFDDTEVPKIIQDYVFHDLRNRHEISYAIIKKNYDVAAAKAAKRHINLLDNQELLRNYFECFNSYLSRAMALKDSPEREIILPKLYALREEYYKITNQDQEQDQDQEVK